MNTNRPLLNGEENPKAKLERLLNERKPLYTSLADLRILCSRNDGMIPSSND